MSSQKNGLLTKESRIFRGRRTLHFARAKEVMSLLLSAAAEAVVYQIRAHPSPFLLFRYYDKRYIQKD